MADCAQDCETNRIQNDNFRLDMTWADQEKRRISFLNAVDRSSVFTQAFYAGFLAQDTYLGFLKFSDV